MTAVYMDEECLSSTDLPHMKRINDVVVNPRLLGVRTVTCTNSCQRSMNHRLHLHKY